MLVMGVVFLLCCNHIETIHSWCTCMDFLDWYDRSYICCRQLWTREPNSDQLTSVCDAHGHQLSYGGNAVKQRVRCGRHGIFSVRNMWYSSRAILEWKLLVTWVRRFSHWNCSTLSSYFTFILDLVWFGRNSHLTEPVVLIMFFWVVQLQTIPTIGAVDVKYFSTGGQNYVFFVNSQDNLNNTNVDSALYRLDSGQFTLSQVRYSSTPCWRALWLSNGFLVFCACNQCCK